MKIATLISIINQHLLMNNYIDVSDHVYLMRDHKTEPVRFTVRERSNCYYFPTLEKALNKIEELNV